MKPFLKPVWTQTQLLIGLFMMTLATANSAFAIKGGSIASEPEFSPVIGIQNCSAVVVHPSVMLTAGHCAGQLFNGTNTVHFSSRLQNDFIKVKTIYTHPNFSPKEDDDGNLTLNFDLAVVILSEPITDQKILSHLPSINWSTKDLPGTDVLAVGLGMSKTGGMNYLGDGNNSAKKKVPYQVEDAKSSVLFLKSSQRNSGACGGDSGGGVLRLTENGYQLLGVLTAIGEFCGKEGELNYSELIAPHRTWIESVLSKEGISSDNKG